MVNNNKIHILKRKLEPATAREILATKNELNKFRTSDLTRNQNITLKKFSHELKYEARSCEGIIFPRSLNLVPTHLEKFCESHWGCDHKRVYTNFEVRGKGTGKILTIYKNSHQQAVRFKESWIENKEFIEESVTGRTRNLKTVPGRKSYKLHNSAVESLKNIGINNTRRMIWISYQAIGIVLIMNEETSTIYCVETNSKSRSEEDNCRC